MAGDEREEMNRPLAENRGLRDLLTAKGIAWQPRDPAPTTERISAPRPSLNRAEAHTSCG